MARTHAGRLVALLAGALLLAGRASDAHVILDGESVRPILAEIAKAVKESRESAGDETGLEALYRLGEKAGHLAELMNLDLLAHGKSLYAELLVQRLREYGIVVTFMERKTRYVYDLAAYRQYLDQAPRGKRAADSRLRLIAEAFRASTGADVAELVDLDVPGLQRAIRQQEAFLEDYPTHAGVKEVRFFLAIDYYRLYRQSRDLDLAKRHAEMAARALRGIITDYPGTAEARAAAMALETIEPGRPQRD